MAWKTRLVKLLDRLHLANPPFHLPYWRWVRLGVLLTVDLLVVGFSYWAAFALRLDALDLTDYLDTFLYTLPPLLICMALAFFVGGMYRQIWRYANLTSALVITKCIVFGIALFVTANFLFARAHMPPRSVPIIFGLIASMLIALSKFSWRAWANLQLSIDLPKKERCFIYGAGSAGDLLARYIAVSPRFPYYPIGYVDDDRNKRGRVIHGVPILGTGDDLQSLCAEKGVKTIILAMHAPSGTIIRGLVERCHAAGAKPLMMPDMANALSSDVIQPRPLDIKDLLRRSPKSIDRQRVKKFFEEKTVLVTGAGGSIGSEICRQIFECHPKTVVLLDSSEFNLYKIEQELLDFGGADVDIDIVPVLGSVRCKQTVDRVFRNFNIHYVLHAAAYKHVPMVEANAIEAILNNVVGTRTVAEAAIRYRVERFLLVSTDKAVRPTNVMGATKRACEILVQALHEQHQTETHFCAVRFGNVLGSSGSVIPRFLHQIQNGGPVTVTHPDVTRYFMLISEAVGLVLQSITMSKGGEIFVLDMGDPVKIYDMAKHLILLAGKEPGKDIEIAFSGLRPGEKLYEELIIEDAERHLLHDDVYIAIPRPGHAKQNMEAINKIIALAENSDEAGAVRLLMALASSKAEPSEAFVDAQKQQRDGHFH